MHQPHLFFSTWFTMVPPALFLRAEEAKVGQGIFLDPQDPQKAISFDDFIQENTHFILISVKSEGKMWRGQGKIGGKMPLCPSPTIVPPLMV